MALLMGLVVISPLIIGSARGEPASIPTMIPIEVNNPYYVIDFRFEIKCDWDPKTNQYKYRDVVVIPAKEKGIVRIPANSIRCEAYPR